MWIKEACVKSKGEVGKRMWDGFWDCSEEIEQRFSDNLDEVIKNVG